MKTNDAVEFAGNKLKLCQLLGISRMSVSHWGYWVPEKHAHTISKMEGSNLTFDAVLYAGNVTLEHKGKIYTPAIEVKSTALLGKAMASGSALFFWIGTKMILVSKMEGDIYNNFRTYPIYEVAA